MRKICLVVLVMAPMVFALGFFSAVSVKAQTDSGFQTFLSRLDGSRWEGSNGAYLELHGDMLSSYRGPFVKVTAQRFTYSESDPNLGKYACIFEISEDGLVITREDVILQKGMTYEVKKFVKVK